MNSIQSAVYNLLNQFIARQTLAYNVMQKLHPDLLLKANPEIPLEDIYKAVEEYSHIPFTGVYEEWNYWFHGMGCKLRHQLTHEPIEWDAPNINVFDFHWLVNWLEWYLEWNNHDELPILIKAELAEHSLALQELIYLVLEQFNELKMITHLTPTSKSKFIMKY